VGDDPAVTDQDAAVTAERATAERNRQKALLVNGLTGAVDDDEYLAHFTDDPVWHVNRRAFAGRDGLRQVAEAVRRVFPNGVERVVRTTVAEGDRVVIQHMNRAVTATGVEYENEYVKVFEFAGDGRIRAVWEYLDSRYAAEVLAPPAAT
jgi:ketosteroid isomerase-like protein